MLVVQVKSLSTLGTEYSAKERRDPASGARIQRKRAPSPATGSGATREVDIKVKSTVQNGYQHPLTLPHARI